MRHLALLAACLTFVVVVVGAYVRLSDAGLGCPDWPLCYGQPLPADIADSDALAKAWKEMGHRYLAAALGFLIFLLALVAWRKRQSPWLATAIAALVVIQATLGKWTVTMLLKPAIVTAHLLGGMAIFALLVWMALSQYKYKTGDSRAILVPAALALGVLVIQIALGGWVSANYAGLACPDLPLCRGRWLPVDALTAIHWSHRVFAVAVLVVVGWAAIRAMQIFPRLGIAIALLLLLQLALGAANVAFGLPLPLAAAHNAGAALLLASLVVLNFFAFRGLRP
ncbi:MAG: COX15/CtaA family protein [Pseudomonadota bacterium]|nr:COX15/CtaA family protein [Pseudomonadota bacterium]